MSNEQWNDEQRRQFPTKQKLFIPGQIVNKLDNNNITCAIFYRRIKEQVHNELSRALNSINLSSIPS